jgi:hypothetical protein
MLTGQEKQKNRALASLITRYCELLHTSPKTESQEVQSEVLAGLLERTLEQRTEK